MLTIHEELSLLREELEEDPYLPTPTQTKKLRKLFPHGTDERLSSLPIAEIVHAEEWF